MIARSFVLLCGLLAPIAVAGAQRDFFDRSRGMLGDPNEYYKPPEFRGNTKYDGRFTFARIKYRGYAHFTNEGPGWAHDYPRAESHFMRIMRELTTMDPFIESSAAVGGNIFALDDPELFRYPVAYLSEPGGWFPTDQEVAGLRSYLLKGGFLIVDDFGGTRDWMNFTAQMQRVLPSARPVELNGDHPIFDSFFKIDLALLEHGYRGMPSYFGIFQGNDPTKRIMAIVNFNNDIGDYWEWSDRGFDPLPSNEAYKLGVNYLIYALTH